ncbi:MAG: PDZ domain-containing protein [Dysgonamonadaceae bacterium]|jgi:tricorn protease|nr:PDZ domain-containing protein [Dysgonamonadaceae bacterium]
MKKLLLFFISVTTIFSITAQEEFRLLRFPAIYGNKVVFTYAGDLYSVSAAGGVANKLTDGDGFEMFARFSPDGSRIAFTGQYDGNTEIYLIPSEGGVPKRITYTATLGRDDISDRMGPNNITLGWRDNEHVIFRSRMTSFNDFKGKLYITSTYGGLPEELPLPEGGFCSYSPDGKQLAYNRVFREFRTWKYYRGGMADDIWIYDFNTKNTVNITNNPAQDIFPMWSGDDYIYFISDRDRIMNLFSYNTKTKQIDKLTNFDVYDIKFPSMGNDAIVFENGGYIYRFDFSSRKAEKLSITINGDFTDSRPKIVDVSRNISGTSLSPDGKKILINARGDIFTVPVKQGIVRNITESSAIHERNPQWSPDGSRIAFISDASGEDEIYIRSNNDLSKDIQITSGGDNYKYAFCWSPDSRKILWSDRAQRLRYIDVETKKITEVEQSPVGEIHNFNWSPDSRWIAYTLPRIRTTNVIVIYNVENKEKHTVTDEWFDSHNAVFSLDGKYLFFSSARSFNPTYGGTEWNYVYNNMYKLYFVTLKKSTPSPFSYTDDESEEQKTSNDKKDNNAKPDKNIVVDIDFDGIAGRSLEVNATAGWYNSVIPLNDVVYYTRNGTFYMFDLKKKKETEIGKFSIASITPDAKKILVRTGRNFSVIDLPKGKTNPEETVDLSAIRTKVNYHAEWNQIYNECWRQMRDFFYDPGMHGINWQGIREKYAPLLPYINNRNDLNYIIGEMIGELSAGHAYIGGGDRKLPARISTGLLGAVISRHKSGYYRIDKILSGRNWSESLRSPLTEAGVNASKGDFITAVNGKSTKDMENIYASLTDKAGRLTELTINKKPEAEGGKNVTIKPINDESALYYFDWVQTNIAKVDQATNGQVGYIHIPDMSEEGLSEFVKHYHPQLNRKALIIDDRGNGGGNVSPMIIERLRREMSMMTMQRNGSATPKPGGMFIGPKVLLMDKYSASDGDLFPYQFKFYKLGKTIGTRSWGGVIGIRGTLPLIDGATLNRPEFAPYDTEGRKWIIEGHGVDPDIVIDNDPAKEYAGEDEQLNEAIKLILEELKINPGTYPEQPDKFPVKNK